MHTPIGDIRTRAAVGRGRARRARIDTGQRNSHIVKRIGRVIHVRSVQDPIIKVAADSDLALVVRIALRTLLRLNVEAVESDIHASVRIGVHLHADAVEAFAGALGTGGAYGQQLGRRQDFPLEKGVLPVQHGPVVGWLMGQTGRTGTVFGRTRYPWVRDLLTTGYRLRQRSESAIELVGICAMLMPIGSQNAAVGFADHKRVPFRRIVLGTDDGSV